MTHLTTSLLVLLLVLVAPLGCSGDDSSEPSPGQTTIDCEQLCTALDNAPGEQALRQLQAASCICNNLVQCEAPVDCEGRLTPSCAGEWTCRDTFCVWRCDEPTGCGSDAECPGEQICVEAGCVEPEPQECRVDDDCLGEAIPPDCANPDFQCDEGTCRVACGGGGPDCDAETEAFAQVALQFAECDEDPACTLIDNPACGLLPGADACWLAVNIEHDDARAVLADLAEQLMVCTGETTVCACPEPFEPPMCVDGRCQIGAE